MVRRSIFVLGVCGVLGWMGGMTGSAAFGATCEAAGRFVSGKPADGKGFKQAVTVAVAPKCAGPCHGLVTYTVQWKDKSGAQQTSTGKTVKYAFLPGQGTASSGGGGSAGTRVVDSTVLEAGACADATPCRVTGAAVNEVSCFKDGGGRCATTASYTSASATDSKGFKQDVGFSVSSDAGSAAHGLVKYTLQWTDKAGAAKTSSKSVPYKGLSGGGGGSEVQVVDDTVLGAGACADSSPCSVTGGAIEKVSCFLDK